MRPTVIALRRRAASAVRAARLSRTARAVLRERLTYLSPAKLASLERALAAVKADGVSGDFVECGVALGGSGVVIASALDGRRAFHGYDLFGTIPPPGEHDPPEAHDRYAIIRSGGSRGLGGDRYYGYVDDLEAVVRRTFERHGVPPRPGRVELHRGLFEDTLHPQGAVALAHIDSDWYDPVSLCLERIHPVLSVGGVIIADDYHDYGGCRRACHEYLAAHGGAIRVVRARPHLIIQRMA